MTLWIIGKRCELPPPEPMLCDNCGNPVVLEGPEFAEKTWTQPFAYVHAGWGRWTCAGDPEPGGVTMAQVDGLYHAPIKVMTDV